MKDEVIIAIISGLVSLCVSWLFFKYQNYKNNKMKEKTLEINFTILIKDIQDLLWYLEDIIKNREILEKYYIQELDYNKILIDYNNLINDRKVIINLLEFYNLRTKIKKYFLEEKIEVPDYLDKEMGVYKKNIFLELSHRYFVESIYKDLENIFIEKKLELQLRNWEDDFKFKPLKEIKKDREKILSSEKKDLKKEMKRIINKENLDLKIKENKDYIILDFERNEKELDIQEKEFLDKQRNIRAEYLSIKSMEYLISTNEFVSIENIYTVLLSMIQRIYNIKSEIE